MFFTQDVHSNPVRVRAKGFSRSNCALATLVPLSFIFSALIASPAAAQYRNAQFGFEGGYFFVGSASGLDSHNFSLGLRGGFKSSDHWWFTGRAHLGFAGEPVSDATVLILHVVPVEVRYYFETDAFRPFAGITNSFQFLFNQTIEANAFWGPGLAGGMEFKLRRDLFLGFQLDAYYMVVFDGDDAPLLTLTTQLIFFL